MFNQLSATTPKSRTRKAKLSEKVVDSLRARQLVLDSEFDRILPFRYQTVSEIHWSPIEVAAAIAQMVEDLPARRFIDLGAGPGKLCVLLALMTDLFISGVERRSDLILTGRELCEELVPGRVDLIQGDMLDLNWNDFDVLYLYNPFQEQKSDPLLDLLIDGDVVFGETAFRSNVDGVFKKLQRLSRGQRLITYHGCGGKIPTGLTLLRSVKLPNGVLKMWEKTTF